MSSVMIIKNGRIVTAVDDYTADILIENERIKCIGENLEHGLDHEVIDATGMLVFPGGIDCHTHLENTFGDSTTADDFLSGTKAAAFGGTTTILEFNTSSGPSIIVAALILFILSLFNIKQSIKLKN